jgi:hypothetical protein
MAAVQVSGIAAPDARDPWIMITGFEVRFADATTTTGPVLAEPTSHQREAFDLIGAPIPLTLK